MKQTARVFLAVLLCEVLIFLPTQASAQQLKQRTAKPPSQCKDLPCYLHDSYEKLFAISPHLEFTPGQIEAERKALEDAKAYCVGQFKAKAKEYADEEKGSQKHLQEVSAKIEEPARHNMHCNIQDYRTLARQAKVLADDAIPNAYANEEAKLDLIQDWPGDLKEIKHEIVDGSYLQRRWGDVKDIGFRTIAAGQWNDIKTGERAIQQMKQNGLMPKALNDPAIVDYVDSVAQRVASHSDLHVPLHVTVLDTKEINAFALPGGYLFVERGLLDAADDEAELAGVMGHEIGHVVARHGHKLMERATMAEIFYQAAEVGAMVLSGGISSIGTYYALEYGFQGVGMMLDLRLLGVSREYELQADQLGIQYAWNSGYDPSGFIRFFDKMATKEGYVEGMSWFRDHPPFYERMVDAEREIMFLPKKKQMVVQTSAFLKMKKELKEYEHSAGHKSLYKPSLEMLEKGCPAPKKMKYKAGEPIETICSTPGAATKSMS